jgi:hypothetical protein
MSSAFKKALKNKKDSKKAKSSLFEKDISDQSAEEESKDVEASSSISSSIKDDKELLKKKV